MTKISPELTTHIMRLIFGHGAIGSKAIIGKEIKTPEDEIIHSYKFNNPFDFTVKLKGDKQTVNIEGVFTIKR